MHRPVAVVVHFKQGFIDKPVGIPLIFLGTYLGQVDRLPHQATENTRLRQSLPVHLPYPSCRTVGRNDYQRHPPVERLAYRRMEVEQSRTGGATNHHGSLHVQRQSDGEETGTALVRHRKAFKTAARGKSLYQRHIAASGTQHRPAYPMRTQQGHKLQHVFLIRIHQSLLSRLHIS